MRIIIHLKESGTLRVVSSLALHSAKMSLFPSMMLMAVMYQQNDYLDEDAKMKMTVLVIIVMMTMLNMRRCISILIRMPK